MSAPTKPQSVLVFDDRVLWHLAQGTRITELSGRVFLVGSKPGHLWHGNTPCTVEALELPVEVSAK
jgi:hypothetical protein